MMAMQYTPNQKLAIERRETNLLISAAAGSGKTRVLVDRIVHMIQNDHVPLHEMLIVTFTNAAAGEMRARLKKGLEDAIRDAEGDIAFLREQLNALPNAHISTMHAFCISELRRFYHVLDIDPNFRILPETTTAILRDQAMEDIMEEAYEQGDTDFLRLVEAYGGRNDDENLRDLIAFIHRRIQSHPNPVEWFAKMAEAADGPLPAIYQERFAGLVEEYCEQMQEDIARMEALMLNFLDEMPKAYDNVLDDASFVRGISKALHDKEPVRALDAYLSNNKLVTKARKPKNVSEGAEEADAVFKATRDEYKKTIDKIKKLLPEGGIEAINADRHLTASYLKTLGTLVRAYAAHYAAEKAEKSGLDYDDLEQNMLKLLADKETRAAIQSEIRYVFFDEYQDANPIQEAIVEGLATPDHLFFVGDVKQAIYRFRRADPNLFNRRYSLYRDSDEGELIFLSENFRSRSEILEFSNALFTTLMTPRLGDVDYSEPGQALICGGSFEPQADAVQVVAIAAENRSAAEARWIAGEIRRLVDAGKYEYSDIVVLMRSPRSRLGVFEETFQQMEIPFYSDNSETSFQNLEVRLFIDMLQVLNNDELDTPLLAGLLSPFGGLDDADVAVIRSAHQDVAFAKAVKTYMQEEEDTISAKLQTFFEAIRGWRAALRYESLEQMSIRLFEESGYAAFLLGMENGVARHENVSAFIDIITAYDREQHDGLPGFLTYVETLEARSMDSTTPGLALSAEDACVRLMSVHKSKGLGFKVVFLADMAHQFNLMESRGALMIDDELGLALNVVDLEHSTIHKPFEKSILNAKYNDETLSEEVRLLYVALTRAIDRLYLVSSSLPDVLEKKLNNRGKIHVSMGLLRNKLSYFDWLLACLCDEKHPLSLDADHRLYQWHLIDEEMLQEEEPAQHIHTEGIPQVTPSDEIARRFRYAYPFEADTQKPFKKTVSELTKGNDIMPPEIMAWPSVLEKEPKSAEPLPMPRFLQEHISFTAANFGTLMHQIVQLLPLEVQDREKISARLDGLVVDAFLTSEERQAVDEEMLANFYNGDFVKWISTHGRKLEQEVSFTMRFEEWVVDGQIDFFFETDEGYHIVDFKTDVYIKPERYTRQLELYAKALSAARGKPVVKKWLYWLRHQTVTEIP